MDPVPLLPLPVPLPTAASSDADGPVFRLAADPVSGSVVLGGVVLCDGSGLSGLVEGHGLAHRMGRRLTVVRSSPCVHRLLADAGLEALLCDPRPAAPRPTGSSPRRRWVAPDRVRSQASAAPPGAVSAATTAR